MDWLSKWWWKNLVWLKWLSRNYEGILIQFQVVKVINCAFRWKFKGSLSSYFGSMSVQERLIELTCESKVS